MNLLKVKEIEKMSEKTGIINCLHAKNAKNGDSLKIVRIVNYYGSLSIIKEKSRTRSMIQLTLTILQLVAPKSPGLI